MNSFVVMLLVSDVVGTAMVPLIIVGATSNKLLNVIDSRCNSAKEVCCTCGLSSFLITI